jgi:hypothetical protein
MFSSHFFFFASEMSQLLTPTTYVAVFCDQSNGLTRSPRTERLLQLSPAFNDFQNILFFLCTRIYYTAKATTRYELVRFDCVMRNNHELAAVAPTESDNA